MKPFLLYRAPILSRSGYGSHSRDILKSLYDLNLFNIKIDSCPWGNTPLNVLENNNLFHNWIKENIITEINIKPDIYIQVTVANEFNPIGKFNIGITAGVETTLLPKDWIDGCQKMDLVITTSNFSKEVLIKSIYQETHNITKEVLKEFKITKPVEVLFEGVDINIFNNKYNGINLDIKEDFCYIFVGHWLSGDIGQDRKDVGMLIKCFGESFKGIKDKPALILKVSTATFSVKEREIIRQKIENITNQISDCPKIYLLFGDLTDKEMNELYNHPSIKSMISITKGEGFGRPLLEFSMTGKPIIASNWSGHKDFLPMNKTTLIGGSLTNVHESASNQFLLKESKWFTANYSEVVAAIELIKNEYDHFLKLSEELRIENSNNFNLNMMTKKLKDILLKYIIIQEETKLILPYDDI